ncbi:nucleoside deaminase [Oceaniglobus ichthyenteri]|uniref:nucleoside deaminase n=1 Tax=Oceaniglobus ichthyenteri TaxID=2136177 RepID=UPI000D35B02B|nr:nucleoside deaminase [Oceaniglobus ichthyenteri]
MVFRSYMELALDQARDAGARGEVPVGAVVVGPSGAILAAAGNRTRELHDPSAHAEILAIRAACGVMESERLNGCDLYVTLEPCPACAGIIASARIARLYYGAGDPKSGGVAQGPRIFSHPQAHHVPEIYDGIGAAPSEALLKAFFAKLRQLPPS